MIRRDSPVAFLITFRCYGTWLHGDPRGSIRRGQKVGEPRIPYRPGLQAAERRRMLSPPAVLEPKQRAVIAQAMLDVCNYRGWSVYAMYVGSVHVHVVVAGECPPERIMHDLKAYATRRLVEAGYWTRGRPLWARHGSTRYLWNDREVWEAVRYVQQWQDRSLGRGYRRLWMPS